MIGLRLASSARAQHKLASGEAAVVEGPCAGAIPLASPNETSLTYKKPPMVLDEAILQHRGEYIAMCVGWLTLVVELVSFEANRDRVRRKNVHTAPKGQFPSIRQRKRAMFVECTRWTSPP